MGLGEFRRSDLTLVVLAASSGAPVALVGDGELFPLTPLHRLPGEVGCRTL
jgi:hypothetical protein